MLVCGLAVACGLAGAAGTDAEKAVAAQVAKINKAWRSDDGAEIMSGVLSDAFMVSIPNPAKKGTWRRLDKEQFCKAFAQMLVSRRPKRHERKTTKITVKGTVAYEDGLSIHENEWGSKADRILNVWRLEGEQWLLFFSAPVPDLEEALGKE